MSDSTTVLILTAENGRDETRLDDLRARLKARRMEPVVREFDGKTVGKLPKRAPQIIFLDFPGAVPANLRTLTKRLKVAYASAPPAFAACLPAENATELHGAVNTTILHPAHCAQIVTRIASLSRLRTMETEMTLRIETLIENFGVTPAMTDTANPRKLRILFVGAASPRFMTLVDALQDSHAEVIAAFTGFTAFDYLHEQDFDAVVLNAITSEEPALTISSTMRRNAKLFHTPTLILSGQDTPVDAQKAFLKGASDVIPDTAPPDEIRDRILEQANFHRIHEDLKAQFSTLGDAKTMDAATGLFNNDFFSAHLNRHKAANRVVPVATFTISAAADESELTPARMHHAFLQTGSMLRNLVRMQDCTARLGDRSFAVLFPCVSLEDANFAAARINAIINESAFQDDAGTYRVTANVSVANAAARAATPRPVTAQTA